MHKSILRASFISMIPKDMEKYSEEPIHFSNDNSTEFYSLNEPQPCDRSDITGLNNGLSQGEITVILNIADAPIAINNDWSHIIKDNDGFYYVVKMV